MQDSDDSPPKVVCTGQKLKSCVCGMQGDCRLKMLDVCDVCQSKHYSAIFLNSTCPDNTLYATCDNSNSVVPPATTCNQPQAYSCQDADRTAMVCNLTSSPQACVCYSNGTCANQPSSACACQNPDIVSVYSEGYCPTNCTSSVSDGSEASEEGENNAESEESEKSSEEAEGKSEEEAEATAKAKVIPVPVPVPVPVPAPKPVINTTNTTIINNNNDANNATWQNISDKFTPNNPDRFVGCSLPGAYTCKETDRGIVTCGGDLTDSCICNKDGICASLSVNQCRACANRDVVTVFEGGFCPGHCQKLGDGNNAPVNAIPNASNF